MFAIYHDIQYIKVYIYIYVFHSLCMYMHTLHTLVQYDVYHYMVFTTCFSAMYTYIHPGPSVPGPWDLVLRPMPRG